MDKEGFSKLLFLLLHYYSIVNDIMPYIKNIKVNYDEKDGSYMWKIDLLDNAGVEQANIVIATNNLLIATRVKQIFDSLKPI